MIFANAKFESDPNIGGFAESEHELRISRTQIALALGSLLMIAGVWLDWSLHPQQFLQLAIVRFSTSGLLFFGFWISKTDWAKARISVFSLSMLLTPAMAIAGMVYLTDGGESTYFFGLILLIIFVQLLGFTGNEAVVYCVATLAAYGLSVYFHPSFSWDILPKISLGLFFLMTSSVLSVIICHLNRKNRFSDFRLRKSLDEKNQHLTNMDSQRMSFLANVSHELRTPLATIVAPLDELFQTRGSLPESTGQSLALIKRSANRLSDLVNDLLEIVRVDNAKLQLVLEDVDAREIVINCVEEMQSIAKAHDLQIMVECTPKPLDLRADQTRMERVLLNLLNNAIKFSPQHSSILVTLTQNGSMAVISVADNGPGIPAEERQRVFERQFQSFGTIGLARGGLGIGLSIAKEIIKCHHGKIWMEPNCSNGTEQGSVFFVSLPIATSPDKTNYNQRNDALDDASLAVPKTEYSLTEINRKVVAEQSLPKVDSLTSSCESSTSGTDVLVIDDEDDLRMFLVDSIRKDYLVAAARNAEEGIRFAAMLRPRCILLDFMLPDMDGISVLKSLKQIPALRDTKVLMLTAHFDDNIKLSALRLGADDFLTKPFGFSELRARVATLVRSSRLQSDLRDEKLAVQQSIAKQREAEGQLYQSEKMRAVAGMAAGLLHEINNPISYSLMAVSALKRQISEDPDAIAIVEDIQNGIKRVSDIISDLRAFAYPEQSNVHSTFFLIEAINTAVRFVKHDKENYEVELNVDCDPRLNVVASPSQISQVIQNLVSNAMIALRRVPNRSGSRIDINASIANGRVHVKVSDNGPGIPEANLEKVTEPFFTTSEPNLGLGLGLSICNSIVNSHGSRIRIVSQEHAGTHVSFDLAISNSEKIDEKPLLRKFQTDPVC